MATATITCPICASRFAVQRPISISPSDEAIVTEFLQAISLTMSGSQRPDTADIIRRCHLYAGQLEAIAARHQLSSDQVTRLSQAAWNVYDDNVNGH